MLLIVTRPLAQAVEWVRELRALGQRAQALPLIEIAPAADAAPVHAAWHALRGYELVVFVSPNAVRQFFALAPPPAPWPATVIAASTGPGTSAALRAAGVGAACLVEPAPDAPSFDSEALWAQLSARAWAGRRVLIVRGEDGRDWLAEALRERGAGVEFVTAYHRQPPQPAAADEALLRSAQAEPASHLWIFSSSEAVANLRALVPGADWSAAGAIASHPRIAQAARAAGFGRVEGARPAPQDVARKAAGWRSIQSRVQ